ncbi:Serine phosphatase RsbU, regulator of sigma subunit [Olavius sp. associated proteobacterium Delta 1]|nr:Serine phosphatase RsbU, regulator of sigma subunit [Olavius sp. associated proteobacterium Delta 1]
MRTKILLVDDDEMLLAGLKRQLRNKFRVETAISGEVAVKMVQENGPYAVVVSDYMMPGMNGIEFLTQVKQTDPDTIRMMLTGSADMTTAIKAVNEGSIYKFHPKPCPAETLGSAIQSGIDEYQKVTTDQTQLKKVQTSLDKVQLSLANASMIQQKLLPKSDPQVDGYDIAGKSISCDETGGDYYDFFNPNEWGQEKIGIVVADVIGHGISAALLMTSVRASFRERILSPGDGVSIVSDVNKRIVQDIEELNLFITMFYSEIDLKNKCFRWVHAGHESALSYDPATDTFDTLGGEGLPLGVMKDWLFEEAKIPIQPGQIILIGTDGIKEACNPLNEHFGNERLQMIIKYNHQKSAKDILNEVYDALERFRGSAKRKDDETMVVIKAL